MAADTTEDEVGVDRNRRMMSRISLDIVLDIFLAGLFDFGVEGS